MARERNSWEEIEGTLDWKTCENKENVYVSKVKNRLQFDWSCPQSVLKRKPIKCFNTNESVIRSVMLWFSRFWEINFELKFDWTYFNSMFLSFLFWHSFHDHTESIPSITNINTKNCPIKVSGNTSPVKHSNTQGKPYDIRLVSKLQEYIFACTFINS